MDIGVKSRSVFYGVFRKVVYYAILWISNEIIQTTDSINYTFDDEINLPTYIDYSNEKDNVFI